MRCRQVGADWQIEVDLAAVPAEVEQIRIVVSLEDDRRFSTVSTPVAQVADAEGVVLVEYPVAGLAQESIVIAVEIYRRHSAWKVRAVGQGYAGGLADLIRDHGVSVEEDEPATQAPAPSAPAPVAVARPPAPAPENTAGPTSLTKGVTVNLTKGQSVSLRKEDGTTLTQVRMGLGWDAGRGPDRVYRIDLDATAIRYAGAKETDKVSFGRLRSKDKTMEHSGDNLTGRGEGDDEVVTVELADFPATVTSVMFTVTSYRGQTFDKVANAYCRLVDGVTGEELVRYTLGEKTPHTGMVMAKLVRTADGWQMTAIGEGVDARTPGAAAAHAARFL